MFNFLSSINPKIISLSWVNSEKQFPSNKIYPKRTTVGFEIDFIYDKEGLLIQNGVSHVVKKGYISLRPPGTEIQGKSGHLTYYVNIDMGLPEDFQYDCPSFIITKNIDTFKNLFKKLYEAYIVSDSYSEFKTKKYLYDIFSLLLYEWRTASRLHKNSAYLHIETITDIKEYIEQNYNKHLTIDELSKMANFSKYFFCRIFTDIVGSSPIDYLNSYRISMAKRFLIETTATITDIYLKCGYENESHFYKQFKQKTGLTPAKFRKIHEYI